MRNGIDLVLSGGGMESISIIPLQINSVNLNADLKTNYLIFIRKGNNLMVMNNNIPK